MTTPGGQLTPGNFPNEGDPPQFGVPEGAFVGEASSPQAITDLNNLNEAEIDRRQSARVAQIMGSSFDQQFGALGIFVQSILGMLQGAVNLVVGTVQTVVDGIKGIFNAVGSLFSAAHFDNVEVDKARVAGENAIVARMGAALDQLDEIQRVGGAYSALPKWEITWGEDYPHPLPLTNPFGEPPYALMQGVKWHDPIETWGSRGDDYRFANNDAARGALARLSGTLELQESGLWMIYFQAALLQGTQRTNTPADLWCYVASSADDVPVGTPPAPGNNMTMYNRWYGTKYSLPVDRIAAYGRAGQYLGVTDTRYGGGNTVSGYMLCSLPSPGWYVHLSCTGYRHFGGAASTMVFATKVNSESLRDSIEDLKVQIAESLPGQPTDKLLDEGAIASMLAEAGTLEASEVVVPENGGGDG